jgi:hypothetical protein
MAFTLNYNGTRITDTLAGALTGADLTAYNAAAVNDLVPISAAGCASLAALSGAYVAGMPTSQITTSLLPGLIAGNTLWQNTLTAATNNPYISGYAYAFRIAADSNKAVGISPGMRIGYSTTATGAGGTAFAISNSSTVSTTTDAAHTASIGYAYYVVKRPSVLIPAGSFPRVFLANLPAGNNYAYKTAAANSSNYSASSITDTTAGVFGGHIAMQMLQLPTKQW